MENVGQKIVNKEGRLEQLKTLLEKEHERNAAKVAYYEGLIAKWEAKGDKMSGITLHEGDVVTFSHGRPGHPQTEREGTVIGFKDTGRAGVFAVMECGEGVDKEIVRIRPSAVISIVSSAYDDDDDDDEKEAGEAVTGNSTPDIVW